MRFRYTSVVVAATKYKAEERAKEATTWMRQNAIWTDRTPEQRIRQDGRNHQSARKGLKAFVDYSETEKEAKIEGERLANTADAHLLNKVNAQRKQEADARDKIKQQQMQDKYLTDARRSGTSADDVHTINVKSSYVPIKRLGSAQSNLTAFHKQYRKDLRLIATIKFTYNPAREYAIWLEVANGGRFGIISRALQYWSARLNADIKQIANLKQFQHISFASQVVSQAEQFEEFAVRESARLGRPYQPFSKAVQAEKNRRRRDRRIGPTKRGPYKKYQP